MHLVFYIGLGAGLSVAAGVRPFVPLLLAGALASAGALGIAFADGRYSFLAAGWWLVVVVALLIVAYGLQLRLGADTFDEGPAAATLVTLGIAAGALLFAGTLSDHGRLSWPGLVGGAACAGLGSVAVRPVIVRARRRLMDNGARQALTLYLDGAALLFGLLACLFHPLGYVLVLLVAWLAAGSRRRDTEKYAGLRVLRR